MAKRICTVEDCERAYKARGLCNRHYKQASRRDQLPPRRTVLERLMAKSERQGECLVWTGSCTKQGYGHVGVDGKIRHVHRAAWVARHGPIPPETPCVLHHCDNPPCWRDEHLWLGTNADNVADKMAKGRYRNGFADRTHCPAEHPYDEANTWVSRDGWRQCRTCNRRRNQEWIARRKLINV
jgi:hypothetical protein